VGQASPPPRGGPVFIGPWSIETRPRKKDDHLCRGSGVAVRSLRRFLLYNRRASRTAGLLRPFIGVA